MKNRSRGWREMAGLGQDHRLNLVLRYMFNR